MIDILICVHSNNTFHDKLLERALNSLCIQTYKDFKVVVVLDSCWPQTKNVLNRFDGRLQITSYDHKKEGLAKAKNFGISKCSADWIAFLDGDDYYAANKLAKQSMLMEQSDIIATQAWDVYNSLLPNESIVENCFTLGQYETDQQIKAELPGQNIICHGSVLIKRKALYDLGGYDERDFAKGQEDYALWLKARHFGYKFYNIPERLYYYSLNTSVER